MTDTTQIQAPVKVNPGGGGWPPEPRVTQAETLLHGEHAQIIRLLGQAAVDAGNAYSLACKRVQEMHPNEEDEAVYLDIVNRTWELQERAVATHRQVADKALALTRRWETQRSRERAEEKIASPGVERSPQHE